MKLHIQNLGPIKEATIDLSKQFYTFVGYNNSGKTYLANLLWCVFGGFNDTFITYLYEKYAVSDGKGNMIVEQDSLNKIPTEYCDYIKSEMLPNILNIDIDSFIIKELILELEIDINISNIIKVMNKEVFGYSTNETQIITDAKLTRNFFHFLLIVLFRLDNVELIDFFPTERLSFMTFYKYFFKIEQQQREEIERYIRKKNKEQPNWKELKEISESTYLRSHKSLIEQIYSTDIEYIKESEYYGLTKDYADLVRNLEYIMTGKINISQENINNFPNFGFQIQDSNETLKLHITSSSINQLSTLYLYWKYWAREEGNFLMIDEPEQNLHPENQIKLTELLIQFANRNNNRVLIATHSPLIAEVINNYLILGQLENQEEERKNLGMADDAVLTPENTGIYFFTGDSVKEYTISDYGTVFEDFKAAQDKVWDLSYKLGNKMYQQLKQKVDAQN